MTKVYLNLSLTCPNASVQLKSFVLCSIAVTAHFLFYCMDPMCWCNWLVQIYIFLKLFIFLHFCEGLSFFLFCTGAFFFKPRANICEQSFIFQSLCHPLCWVVNFGDNDTSAIFESITKGRKLRITKRIVKKCGLCIWVLELGKHITPAKQSGSHLHAHTSLFYALQFEQGVTKAASILVTSCGQKWTCMSVQAEP